MSNCAALNMVSVVLSASSWGGEVGKSKLNPLAQPPTPNERIFYHQGTVHKCDVGNCAVPFLLDEFEVFEWKVSAALRLPQR